MSKVNDNMPDIAAQPGRDPEGTMNNSCNGGMISFIFRSNEDVTFGDFREKVSRPFCGALRCHCMTFFCAPSVLSDYFIATARLMK